MEKHAPEAAPSPTPDTSIATTPHQPVSSARLGKLKTAFMYVLIAGLAAAAITSVVALLVGQFTSTIGKALLTILVFFTHSLIILAVLWADRFNQVGRLLLPTSIVVLVFANMITFTLGTWEILPAETMWRLLGLYSLALGAIFIIVGLLRFRLAHQATQIAIYTSIGLVAALIIAVAPWVLQVVDRFDPLYFRIVAALAILAATALIISVVLRGIALGHNDSLKLTAPEKQPIPGGLLAVYITVGVITAMVWCTGFVGFLVSGVQSSSPYRDNRYEPRNRYY